MATPFLRAQNSLQFENEEIKSGRESRITVGGRLQAYQKRNSAAMNIFRNTIAKMRGRERVLEGMERVKVKQLSLIHI